MYIHCIRFLPLPITYHSLFLVSGNLAGKWIIIESLGCMDNGHYKFSSLLKIQFSSPENYCCFLCFYSKSAQELFLSPGQLLPSSLSQSCTKSKFWYAYRLVICLLLRWNIIIPSLKHCVIFGVVSHNHLLTWEPK